MRNVLGDPTYESFARKGETMTSAEMATYAHDEIDQARAELDGVSTSYESLVIGQVRRYSSPSSIGAMNHPGFRAHQTRDGSSFAALSQVWLH